MPTKSISLSGVTGDRPGSPKAETAAGSKRVLRRAASESEVPRFYFPNGKPRNEASEKQLREAYKVFQNFPKCEVHYNDFHKVVKVSFFVVRAKWNCSLNSCNLIVSCIEVGASMGEFAVLKHKRSSL